MLRIILPSLLPLPLPLLAMTVPPPLVIQAVLFISLLVAASVTDIRKRIIPNTICALVALAGLICFSPAKLFGILAALPLLIPAVCKEGSIGGGDIKLTAAVGLVLGFEGGITGLTIGLSAMLLFLAVNKVIGWLRKGKCREKNETPALPMAPFLSIGFIAVHVLTITGV